MKREFVEKLIEAKQCEMEAVSALLPERVRPHMDIISKELGDMAKELLLEKRKEGTEKKVRKVHLE